MADEEITLYFNSRRLAALELYLSQKNCSLSTELEKYFDQLYERVVPKQARLKIERQIDDELRLEIAEQEAARRFAVVHFHEGDEDCFVTSELRNSFYSLANLYRHYMKDDVSQYDLDTTVKRNLSDIRELSAFEFAAYCYAMDSDQRITALVEFDFDENTVGVFERGSSDWSVYRLKDVSTAMFKAERKEGLRLESRYEIFEQALADKDISIHTSIDEATLIQL